MVTHIFVWLFVFTVPWQNMLVLPGLGTVSSLLGIGAIGATIVHVILRGRVRPLVPFHYFATAFFLWVFLSAFWGVARQQSMMKDLNTYLQVFIMLWMIWEASPTASRLVNLLQAYVLGTYVAAGSTIINYISGVGFREDAERYAASGFDPNDLGSLLALGLPMAWYIASVTPRTPLRWLNRLYLIVGPVGILLTGSRGALLATVVACAVVPLTLSQVRRGLRVAAVVVMIGAGVAAVQLVPESSFERLSTTGSEISEGTLNNRLRIWKGGIATVPARPLHGYGPAGWYPAVGLRIGNVAPHSTWLAVLVEEGLIGLFIYLAMFVAVAKRLFRLNTFDRRVGLALLATLMMAMTPLSWNQNKASWLVLALLAAWGHVLTPVKPAESPDLRIRPSPRRPGSVAPPVPVT